MTITICSSAHFYRQAVAIQAQLEAAGHSVIIPVTAETMKQTGNFDPSYEKTTRVDKESHRRKAEFIRAHFNEVQKADAILVLNNEKNGIQNYIGGNVLMEMALAFYLHKPIFLMNEIPQESVYLDEILGLLPIPLHGVVDVLPQIYEDIIAEAQKAS